MSDTDKVYTWSDACRLNGERLRTGEYKQGMFFVKEGKLVIKKGSELAEFAARPVSSLLVAEQSQKDCSFKIQIWKSFNRNLRFKEEMASIHRVFCKQCLKD